MTDYIVYSDIWFDPNRTSEGNHLRLAVPITQMVPNSIPGEHRPFIANMEGIGFVQFDFLGFIKEKGIYQATGLHRCGPDQLPLPLVKLAAAPLLVAPSVFR